MKEIIHDRHILFTASLQIKEICYPLFSATQITDFEFIRIYADGSRIYLTTLPERTAYLARQDYQESTDYDPNFKKIRFGYVLWDMGKYLLPESSWSLIEKKIADGSNIFNSAHGIALFENHLLYNDYYNFGTRANNPYILPFYLSHMDVLNAFLIYFKEKAINLIQQAEKHKIIPMKIHPKSIWDGKVSNNEESLLDTEKLINTFLPKKMLVNIKNVQSYFTKRENQFLLSLCKGGNIKSIAAQYGVSPRTVETHLNHIKEKLKINTTSELIKEMWQTEWIQKMLSIF